MVSKLLKDGHYPAAVVMSADTLLSFPLPCHWAKAYLIQSPFSPLAITIFQVFPHTELLIFSWGHISLYFSSPLSYIQFPVSKIFRFCSIISFYSVFVTSNLRSSANAFNILITASVITTDKLLSSMQEEIKSKCKMSSSQT